MEGEKKKRRTFTVRITCHEDGAVTGTMACVAESEVYDFNAPDVLLPGYVEAMARVAVEKFTS